MAKGDNSPTNVSGSVADNALNKIEIPIPPESLKMGLRLVIDLKHTKVRLQVETLASWS